MREAGRPPNRHPRTFPTARLAGLCLIPNDDKPMPFPLAVLWGNPIRSDLKMSIIPSNIREEDDEFLYLSISDSE